MKISQLAPGALAMAIALASATSSQAALTVYSGFDLGASTIGANSISASNAFNAAVGVTNVITFESLTSGINTNGATAAPGVTLSSANFNIRNTPACSASLCGDNTTPAGANFAYSNNANAFLTFTFLNPISAFGAYFGGLQNAALSSLTFFNGSSQSIPIRGDDLGGFAFVGFNDPGAMITSVTVNVPFDLISVDDVRYAGATAVVPEPGTWAMMIIGFGAAGSMIRRRKAVVA